MGFREWLSHLCKVPLQQKGWEKLDYEVNKSYSVLENLWTYLQFWGLFANYWEYFTCCSLKSAIFCHLFTNITRIVIKFFLLLQFYLRRLQVSHAAWSYLPCMLALLCKWLWICLIFLSHNATFLNHVLLLSHLVQFSSW